MNSIYQGSMSSASMSRSESDDEIDLGRLLGVVWRGRWIILFLTALAVLIGGYYAYVVATPLYRSTSVVLLEPRQQNIVNLDSVANGLSGDYAELNSEIQILRGRSLMAEVVDELNLTEDPEFNGSLREPSRLDVARAAVISRLRELLRGAPEATPAAPLDPDAVAHRQREAAISILLSKLSVVNLRHSFVFQITIESEDPQKAALLADTIAERYIQNQLAVKLDAMTDATRALSQLVAEEQEKLEAAEAERARFSSTTDLISPEGLVALERQLKESRDRLAGAEEERSRLSAELALLDQAADRQDQLALTSDPLLERLITQQRDGWEADFDTRVDALRRETEAALLRQEQQITLLEQSVARLETQIEVQGADLIKLQQLTREANATRATYEHLLTRLSETAVQQGVQQADSRVLSRAVVPGGPSEPRKSRILALSGALGLLAGGALVLLLELRHRGFRVAAELEQATGKKVLGQIPLLPERKRKRALEYLVNKPTSAGAEAVRNLRTALLLSNVDSPPKVIVLTSSLSGEGKTTNALALAQNLSAMGRSVLVIEGDIRRRVFSEYFTSLPKRGVVSILSGEAQLDDVLYTETQFGFDLLVGEKSKANAGDLFSSKKFEALIHEARGRYDHVIIDTPPVLLVPDAMIIARHGDAFVFNVQWDETTETQLQEALRQIQNTGQDVTGLVLSQISQKGMKRYGYGRYGAYGAYGSGYYTN